MKDRGVCSGGLVGNTITTPHRALFDKSPTSPTLKEGATFAISERSHQGGVRCLVPAYSLARSKSIPQLVLVPTVSGTSPENPKEPSSRNCDAGKQLPAVRLVGLDCGADQHQLRDWHRVEPARGIPSLWKRRSTLMEA